MAPEEIRYSARRRLFLDFLGVPSETQVGWKLSGGVGGGAEGSEKLN